MSVAPMSHSTSSAAVVISHRIGLSAAAPYVGELTRLGYRVVVYCLGDFDDTARALWPDPALRVLGPNHLAKPWWASLHQSAALTLSTLHPGLNPDQRPMWPNRSAVGRSARRSIRWLLSRLNPVTVNRWLQASASIATSVFEEDVVFVITTSTQPWLHAAGRVPTISVLESWDHPVRKTAGYQTDVVISWNRDLGDDWIRYQGANVAFVVGPWKLEYAINAFPLSASSKPDRQPRLMYAVGTGSETPAWYEAETQLIDLVAEAASDAGWQVTLKLKPNGSRSDYLEIVDRHPHVRVTDEQSSPNPMDYHLDKRYNQTRLEELAAVDLVINSVTTFALDAACAGVPVLQLAGFRGDGLTGIRSASRNYHLTTYLMNDPTMVLTVDSTTIRDELGAWLRKPDLRAVEYSSRVRTWLVPEDGMETSLRNAVAAALNAVGLTVPLHGKSTSHDIPAAGDIQRLS